MAPGSGEESRVDPVDGAMFTLAELFALQARFGAKVPAAVVESYWRQECQLPPGCSESSSPEAVGVERRVNPCDGRAYTLAELHASFVSEFSIAEIDDYWAGSMPQQLSKPGGLLPKPRLPEQRNLATVARNMGISICRVKVPFAAAALWASQQSDLQGNDGSNADPSHAHAISAAWRYALNNLRLAVGMPSTADCARCSMSLQGIAIACDAVETFSMRPSLKCLQELVARCKTVFEAWSFWLAAQGPSEIDVPEQTGISHLSDGQSAAVTRDAKVDIGGPSNAKMPLLAFGTWGIYGLAAYEAVLEALRAGYRHIDTANDYQNEVEVGRAVRDSGIPREEIFIASKLTQHDCRRWNARESVLKQLKNLGVEYIDLYMLHQMGDRGSRETAWRELEMLHSEGKVRSLGVSNFTMQALEDLLLFAKVPPVYCQNKMSVYAPGEQRVSPDSNLLAFCRTRKIHFMAYSVNNPWPLSLAPMKDPHVVAVAKRYNRTPAQLLLRWALQLGAGVLAKTTSSERMYENRAVLDFCITNADIALLTGLVTLAESTSGHFSPRWIDDVYDLKGLPQLRTLL